MKAHLNPQVEETTYTLTAEEHLRVSQFFNVLLEWHHQKLEKKAQRKAKKAVEGDIWLLMRALFLLLTLLSLRVN